MLVDPKGLGQPPVFSGREEHFYVSGVFPNVRGALTFAAESQDVVTSATVAIGVLELGAETSGEIDVQLFVVLSALTEGESFDIVMSAGGDHGFESWRKLHGSWNPYTAGRARSLLREILSPTRAKLPELLREEIKTYCECRGHENARNTKQKGSSHPGGDDPMDIGALGKGKGKQGQQGQGQGQEQGFG